MYVIDKIQKDRVHSSSFSACLHATNEECLGLYGQVNKRIWWMPWRQQAMKDVVICDKPRRADKQALTRGFPNGETHLIY